jgi:pimeloyl-ACP methyl ester carboxylesterase
LGLRIEGDSRASWAIRTLSDACRPESSNRDSDLSTAPESVYLRAGGLRLRCLLWGHPADPLVLLIHGAGMLAHAWAPIVPGLLPGWRIIAPDLRGHGESDWVTPPRYVIEDFAGDLLGVLDALAAQPAVLIGHSMGGRIAAWIAAHAAQRARALVLIDTRLTALSHERVRVWRGVRAGRGARRGHPTRAAAMASCRITPDEPGVAAHLRKELASHAVHERAPGNWALRFDRAVQQLEGTRTADLTALLPGIRCPTLVMRGESSTVLEAAKCAAMAAALGNCRVRVFPGGHHFLLAHPEPVAAALRSFLQEL